MHVKAILQFEQVSTGLKIWKQFLYWKSASKKSIKYQIKFD